MEIKLTFLTLTAAKKINRNWNNWSFSKSKEHNSVKTCPIVPKTWFRFFYDKCTKFLFNMYNLCTENEQKLLVDQSIDSTKSICPPSSNVLSKRARFKWQIRYVLIVTSPFRVPLVHVAWNIWQARSSPAWCLVFRNCWWDSQTQKLLDIGCSCLLSVKKTKPNPK